MTRHNRLAIGMIGAALLGLCASNGCQRKQIEPPVPESEIDALNLDVDTGVDSKGPPASTKPSEPDAKKPQPSSAPDGAPPSPTKS